MKPIKAIIDLVRDNRKPGIRMAEVGVFDGTTTFHYAQTIKACDGHLFMIDWFKGSVGCSKGKHAYRENGDELYNYVLNQINKLGLSDHVTVLYGKSVDMACSIEDNSLDICFIDADHTYKAASKDIEAYLPKVKSGGILCGHDCEDINLANKFSDEELQLEWMTRKQLAERNIANIRSGCHPGVIQAVYDKFGTNVELVPDPHHKIPIWVYRA